MNAVPLIRAIVADADHIAALFSTQDPEVAVARDVDIGEQAHDFATKVSCHTVQAPEDPLMA